MEMDSLTSNPQDRTDRIVSRWGWMGDSCAREQARAVQNLWDRTSTGMTQGTYKAPGNKFSTPTMIADRTGIDAFALMLIEEGLPLSTNTDQWVAELWKHAAELRTLDVFVIKGVMDQVMLTLVESRHREGVAEAYIWAMRRFLTVLAEIAPSLPVLVLGIHPVKLCSPYYTAAHEYGTVPGLKLEEKVKDLMDVCINVENGRRALAVYSYAVAMKKADARARQADMTKGIHLHPEVSEAMAMMLMEDQMKAWATTMQELREARAQAQPTAGRGRPLN